MNRNFVYTEHKSYLALKELQVNLNDEQIESIHGGNVFYDFVTSNYNSLQDQAPILPELSYIQKGIDWGIDKLKLPYDGPINLM